MPKQLFGVIQMILETFQFNGRLLAAGDKLTKELGLSSALWQVIGAIGADPLPLAQIARNMGLTRQSVRRTTNVLRERGFVEFHENPNHKNAVRTIVEGSAWLYEFKIMVMVAASMLPPLKMMPMRPAGLTARLVRAARPRAPEGSTTIFMR